MNKILLISTRYPFPIFGGDKLSAFDIAKFLSKKNQIDLVCLGKKGEIQNKNLAFCNDVKVFHLNFLSRIFNTIFSFLLRLHLYLRQKLYYEIFQKFFFHIYQLIVFR